MVESPTSLQHSDALSEETDRENTLLNKKPVTTFKHAYVEPKQTRKPPARGRKTFAFWTLVVLLFLSAVGNLVLTMTIVGVLRLGNGMQSIELVPDNRTIKLFGNVDLGNIYKQDGRLEGFRGENLDLEAEDGSVLINLYSRANRMFNRLKMNKNSTNFNGYNAFAIKIQEQKLFEASNPIFHNLRNVNMLKTSSVEANKIRSKLDDNLKIDGDVVHLRGSEGARIVGREIVWSADQDIYIRSVNGSIVLSGQEGTYVDVKHLPVARLTQSTYVTAQFKICVCMPQGKLFRMPIADARERVYCNQADMSPQFNPCM